MFMFKNFVTEPQYKMRTFRVVVGVPQMIECVRQNVTTEVENVYNSTYIETDNNFNGKRKKRHS